MIVIAGRVTIDPDKAGEAVEAMVPMVEATLEEDGCIDYVLSMDPVQPGLIRIFEKWEDDDSLTAHIRSEHMAEYLGRMAGFGVTERLVERFDGATVSRLM